MYRKNKPRKTAKKKYAKKYYPRAPVKQHEEFKAYDFALATSNLDTTGSIQLLNTITQGDDISNREGRQLTIKSIELMLQAQADDTTGVRQECLTMLVYDLAPQGALPAIGDILASAMVRSARNLNNRHRFIVLKRWDYMVYPDTTANNSKLLKYYKKHNLTTTYNNTGSGIQYISNGALYLVTLGTVESGATAGNVYGNIRLRFIG